MSANDGGPDVDLGAAAYVDVPLDYLDTGRDQMVRPIVTAQDSRESPQGDGPSVSAPGMPGHLTDAFGGAFALLVETGPQKTMRRRLVMSLAAAQRAQHKAAERGHRCRVAVVQLSVIAELPQSMEGGGSYAVAESV